MRRCCSRAGTRYRRQKQRRRQSQKIHRMKNWKNLMINWKWEKQMSGHPQRFWFGYTDSDARTLGERLTGGR